MSNSKIITVTQLNKYLKSIIEENKNLVDCLVKGEISNLKEHYASGHIYFTLKDNNSSVRVIMFKGYASKLKFKLSDGMSAVIRGKISLYERDCGVQMYASDILPEGMGALNFAFEQLKSKLEKEGLFDQKYKKTIPKFPNIVGVVTSGTGAAFQDILNIFRRRYPLIKVLLISVLVQGDSAPKQIADGIEYLNKSKSCDVIITGRGGGSIEELWAFNTEIVARAIFNSNIPVISAVGHETDFTIADFVADMRAPTPSAAAEIAVPDREHIKKLMYNDLGKCYKILQWNISMARKNLDSTVKSGGMSFPQRYIDEQRIFLDRSIGDCYKYISYSLKEHNLFLSKYSGILDALSPLKTLSRGYSIVKNEDLVVKSIDNIKKGDIIDVTLEDGNIQAEVKKTQRDKL